jgi:NTP pyrophosphatase (non-canonical NTP hydrolase)
MNDARIKQLAVALRKFARERDWDQFHSPKNLAMALNVESGELMEHFQWLTAEESDHLSEEQRARVRLEIADVFLYLIRMSDRLGVDIIAAAFEKMAINAKKYPIELAKGSNKKYTDLD